jgi:site-specific DNA-methyltransferase (adenine-specific)
MILTDPPYGVAYVENKKDFNKLGMKDTRAIIGDQLQGDGEYTMFTKTWLDAITPYMDSYNSAYIFNSDAMYPALREGMEQSGLYYSQGLIWIKNSVVVGRKDYLPQHELIAYGWYGRHKFERAKAKSIILYPKPSRSKLHPTMKPVGLLRRLIPNSTKLGEWVYDAFGGSGSTLIACEHMQRRCLMVEMDPQYVETILARWEKLTGQKAKKV